MLLTAQKRNLCIILKFLNSSLALIFLPTVVLRKKGNFKVLCFVPHIARLSFCITNRNILLDNKVLCVRDVEGKKPQPVYRL